MSTIKIHTWTDLFLTKTLIYLLKITYTALKKIDFSH